MGQVTLSQQGKVVPLPLRICPAFQNSPVRVPAAQPDAAPSNLRLYLSPQKRRQLNQRQTPRERFGNVNHQRRRNGTQQQETSVPFSVLVNGAAQASEKLRPGLRLVENQQFRICCQPLPFEVEPQTLRLLLQVEVDPSQRFRQCGLPALPGPYESHSRVCCEAL